jgi:hypothetical protein
LLAAPCALIAVLLAFPVHTAATGTPPFAKDPVDAAWQRAQESGVYQFTTTVVETTHPAPTVANVGRSSREERLYLEGETNLPESALRLTLWRNGGNVMKLRDGVELRIEADRAYGREIVAALQRQDVQLMMVQQQGPTDPSASWALPRGAAPGSRYA